MRAAISPCDGTKKKASRAVPGEPARDPRYRSGVRARTPVNEGDYQPELDGLRAIAVALVLWAHWGISTSPLHSLAKQLSQPGYVGVDLFFVLSGYLVTRSLLRLAGEPKRWRIFWSRRAARILPIYLLTVVLCHFFIDGRLTAVSLLFVQNIALSFDSAPHPLRHTWSLAVEEHFYLLWPFAVFIYTNRVPRIAVVVALTAIATTVVLPMWSESIAYELLYRGTNARGLSLCLGALLATAKGSELRRCHVVIAATGVAALGAVALFGSRVYAAAELKYLVSAGSCALVVGYLVRSPESLAVRVLSSRALVSLGKVSYGVYLYHYPLYYLAGAFDDTATPLSLTLAIVLTLLVATVSYNGLERPLLQWVRRREPLSRATTS